MGENVSHGAQLTAALEVMRQALHGEGNLCAVTVFKLSGLSGVKPDGVESTIEKILTTQLKPTLETILTSSIKGGQRTKSANAYFYRLLCYTTGRSNYSNPNADITASPNTEPLASAQQAALLKQYAPLFKILYPPRADFKLDEHTLMMSPGFNCPPCFDHNSATAVLSLLNNTAASE